MLHKSSWRGPIMAIFVNPRYIAKLANQQPPRSAVLNVAAAREAGVLAFCCTLDDVDADGKVRTGWSLHPDGQWWRIKVPLPQVIYDRGVRFPAEQKPLVRQRRQLMVQHAMPINTALAFNKWRSYRIVSKDANLSRLLPDTIRYNGVKSLKEMLDKHPRVLLKPIWGSGGSGILLLTKIKNGKWELRRSSKYYHPSNIEELHETILKLSAGKSLIIQEQLPLLKLQGRPCDIRILVAKDRQGEWRPVSSRLRLGSTRKYVTNTRKGAERLPLVDTLLDSLGPSTRTRELLTRIHAASVALAECLEARVGPMGEMGLDLALDTGLNIWFLEANAIPDKVPMECEVGANAPLIYRCIMDYAWYLCDHRSRD